jgi:hypothetical protein
MSQTPKYTRLSKTDAACLLVDHQAGLTSRVQDFTSNEFKNNVLGLAACAKYFNLRLRQRVSRSGKSMATSFMTRCFWTL